METVRRMWRVQLALKYRDKRAKVLQRAHGKTGVLIPHVGMQTTAHVSELEYGHEKLHDSLNFFQSGTRVNENWIFQLDGGTSSHRRQSQ